jgi:hypothetical protein
MIAQWSSLLLLLLFFVKGCESMDHTISKQPTPRFVVVLFANEQAEIVAQGVMSQTIFQRLFLDSYELNGERYHPGKDAVVQGVLLAGVEANFVTVPIWTWEAEGGTTRFLCQASDDGDPPAFSVFSRSQGDMLNQVVSELSR